MSDHPSLHDDLDSLIQELEQALLDPSEADAERARARVSEVHDRARSEQFDRLVMELGAVHESLKTAAPALPSAEELLPHVFSLRDILNENRHGGEHGATDVAPFLELDLQAELDEVTTLDETAERILNSRAGDGESLYRIVLRTDPAMLDLVETELEASLQILRYVRQERTARIAMLVLAGERPDVNQLLADRIPDSDVVRQVDVRTIDPARLQRSASASRGWYGDLPHIAIHADQEIMERIWPLIDMLDKRDQGGSSAVWDELRYSLGGALTVNVREMLAELKPHLEHLAESSGHAVDVAFIGADAHIGAEIAEPLRSALSELLGNAIIHGMESAAERSEAGKPPRGRVECAVEESAEAISISIRDDGPGVDPETIRRAKNGRRGGLARARAIVNSTLGGSLRLRSGTRGAHALVELPARMGLYRGVVFVRSGRRLVVPAPIVEWMGEIDEHQFVVDSTGAGFARHLRALIPIVQPVGRTDRDESGATGGADAVTERPSHMIVLRLAGRSVAVAADALQAGTVVVAAGRGPLTDEGNEPSPDLLELNALPL